MKSFNVNTLVFELFILNNQSVRFDHEQFLIILISHIPSTFDDGGKFFPIFKRVKLKLLDKGVENLFQNLKASFQFLLKLK